MLDRAFPSTDHRTERIRYVVRQLRGQTPGLAQLPMGLALPCMLLFPWIPHRPGSRPPVSYETLFVLNLLLFAASLGAGFAINRWYARRFGQVLGGDRMMNARAERPGQLLLLGLLFLGLYFFETADILHFYYEPAPLALAAMFVSAWAGNKRVAPHQGVLAAVLLIGVVFIGNQSLLSQHQSLLSRHHELSATVLMELVLVVHALCDHLVIVHTLPAPPEEPDEDAVP